jgi:predicted O-methyltransferase YrrM
MTTETFQKYQQHYMTPSDIQHHLGLLFSLAKGNVLELGTRGGVSTQALLAGVERHGGHVYSVDIEDCSQVANHAQWTFTQASSTDPTLPDRLDAFGEIDENGEGAPFDLVLIDTEHTYEQASAELALWGLLVRPGGHILMHDPETFPGVRRAAREFAAAHGWAITIVTPCNGMAVLRRPEYPEPVGVSAEGASWAMEAARDITR